ncbi:MAG: IS110 family transposase [Gammaproteobacteria bacterium]|nr:IS110 family transposase [Gammaproteobacteria bacterium]
MRFYTHQHRYTCGIDLHARSLYVCILDNTGQKLVHKNIKASPETLLKLITDYQDDLIIGVECMFSSATAPALLYLLHPCSRGTGLLISAKTTEAGPCCVLYAQARKPVRPGSFPGLALGRHGQSLTSNRVSIRENSLQYQCVSQ